ncbi:hypothetical protein CRG98_012625 [Punica granatum]|uniref:Uncharacterized protein n=1 Tax=Punica granatum TaxID=22663 RepID=A0A2I0KF94_PUNGR|nr:hypothetical protein CRG98_012625 [Punica granatum]
MQKLGDKGHGLKSRKGESWQKESINHFLARSKTSLRRPMQKLGDKGHGLKSRKGESWQKESINHFLARSKTLKGRPRQKPEDPRGTIENPKGRSPLTDSYLLHAIGRALNTSEIVKGCAILPNHRRQRRASDEKSLSVIAHNAIQTQGQANNTT